VWADENQIVRVAFIDSNDDIVQVELSGKGELAIEFEEGAYSPPPLSRLPTKRRLGIIRSLDL